MDVVATFAAEGWTPGFGDNDFLGWTITVTYFIAAGLCVWAWKGESTLSWRARISARPGIWSMMAGLLVLLGVNKQLDLQAWLVPAAKSAIRDMGLWPSRATIAAMVGAATLIFLSAATVILLKYLGRTRPRYQMALIGLVYLTVFVAARAGSFLPGLGEFTTRHLDAMHLCLELGSLIMIGASASNAIGFVRHRARAAMQDVAADQGGLLVIKTRRPMSEQIELPEAARQAA